MKRSKFKDLVHWKNSPRRKPLVFLGARQVGKTWLVQEFGKREYRQLAYVNFEHSNAPRGLFEMDFDINRVITVLNAYCQMRIDPRDTLIFFDEIQAAPKGITALKYFRELAPEYHVVAAGSLPGVNIHEGESFPVGKVDFMHLGPMDFFEFLRAVGEHALVDLMKSRDMQSLSFFHEKLLNYLRYYLYVGGMPEAVQSFAENRDWNEVREIQLQILESYRNDFSKHVPKEILPRVNMVFDSIPSQLSKENKKFVYGVMKEGGRAKEFETAIQWLVDSGLLHKVYNADKAALPLSAYRDLSAFKLYHNDVGLLGATSHLSMQTIVNGNDIFTEFKGALAEQFVYQQLRQNKALDIYYHTFNNSKFELDFLVQNAEDEIVPVEVKSGANLRAKSFKTFCEREHPAKAIKVSVTPYKEEHWMTNVPLYCIGRWV